MANYYADRIRIGSERNLENEETRETPQKVELGLGVKKAILCSVKAQENNELFRFFFFFSSSSSFALKVIALAI